MKIYTITYQQGTFEFDDETYETVLRNLEPMELTCYSKQEAAYEMQFLYGISSIINIRLYVDEQ